MPNQPSSGQIATVTGTIGTDRLGAVLMHEHLTTEFDGWRADPNLGPFKPADALAIAVDRVEEMKAAGIDSMVDPCPIDLGRDIEFGAEVAGRTNFNIVMATGLYLDNMAGPHWKFAAGLEGPQYLADVFIRELTEGVGDTDLRAGIIKVATGSKRITRYEQKVFEAAAIASNATGAPITTHTDRGLLGDEQQALLVSHGVPPHRIIIGHSCASGDPDYHARIARAGSYLGFDRFGLQRERPDDERVDALCKSIDNGFDDRIVVSQDTVFCWPSKPPSYKLEPTWHVLRFVREIAPLLKARGVTDAQLERLLVENPRRYFDDVPIRIAPTP
jgi:phosphotriesterase-related protein